jgi:hypothetical protein
VPLDSAEVSAATATYDAARETFERLRSFGINYVYTHNYGCEPGTHLSFAEILRAADDAGMLVGLSQPHFSQYEWKAANAGEANGYSGHAAYYVRAAGNHPSVISYVMSHNATGYDEDMNPDMIDGVHDPRDNWSQRNAAMALRAEAIVRLLDPGRIVYHHASGNLGAIHNSNFYPNMAPAQELSDWFGHWAAEGVKPVFTCEYSGPLTWDWTMYRGWYKGEREFGSARVPWEFCVAEWNAQFFGGEAYRVSEPEKANLRWEAKQFREGKLWHRWDYPNQVGSDRFEEQYPVMAMYVTDNWRAHMGRVRNQSVGIRALLEAPSRSRPEAHGTPRGLGTAAASGIQPRLHRRATRTHGPCLRTRRLDSDRRGASPHSQQPAAARVHRRQREKLHRQGSPVSSRGYCRKTNHRS